MSFGTVKFRLRRFLDLHYLCLVTRAMHRACIDGSIKLCTFNRSVSSMSISEKKVYTTETRSEDEGVGSIEEQRPTTFWGKAKKFLEVQPSNGMTIKEMFLYNPDLKPVESARRLWKWWNFIFFWIADALNINSLQIASTGVEQGMTWWQTWISVWLGYFIAAGFVVMLARIGAFYHVSFPVACRASFGTFGSLWPVINRIVMAIIWFSVQSWIMGQCVQLMLRAIFGNDLDQRIGTQHLSGTTSFQFLSFFLGWLGQMPFLWFSPQSIRHLFTVKSIVVPICGVAYLIWTLKRASGLGEMITAKSTLSSHDLGWQFVNSTMNCVANFAALIINAPDFSRFAATKDAPFFTQLFTIPVSFSLATLVGILAAAASKTMYGEVLWSPLDILSRFLDNYTSGDRGGVFLIATGFCLAQLGTNIAANSLSAGTDLTALLPKYMNIRRGSYVCGLLALCLVPWNFFSSSNKFTTYLSAYSVFLSSIAGVICCDYYVIRRGHLIIDELYNGTSGSTYMFGRLGVNWRAYAAYLLGLVPNMPGFVGQTGRPVPMGAFYVYYLNYFVGFLVSFLLYLFFCWLSPVDGVPEGVKLGKNGWYEHYADVEDFDRDFNKLHNKYNRSITHTESA